MAANYGERMAISPQYLAGCIDCDGSIGIAKLDASKGSGSTKIRHELRLAISNTDFAFLEQIQTQYGGAVRRDKIRKIHWKPAGFWRTQGANAEAILREIYPYLIIKRERAEVALKMRETFHGSRKAGLSKETINFREECFSLMKKLNQKGVQL